MAIVKWIVAGQALPEDFGRSIEERRKECRQELRICRSRHRVAVAFLLLSLTVSAANEAIVRAKVRWVSLRDLLEPPKTADGNVVSRTPNDIVTFYVRSEMDTRPSFKELPATTTAPADTTHELNLVDDLHDRLSAGCFVVSGRGVC